MHKASTLLRSVHAEAARADSKIRWVRVCSEGDEIRQGDVYLYRLGRAPEHGPLIASRQLAPGTSKGSRHIMEGPVSLYENPDGDDLGGPYVHVRSRTELTHPEHAHVSLPPGWYETRYQRQYPWTGSATGLERAAD